MSSSRLLPNPVLWRLCAGGLTRGLLASLIALSGYSCQTAQALPLDSSLLRQHVLTQLKLPATETLTVTPIRPLELPEGAKVTRLASMLDRQFSNRAVIRVYYETPDHLVHQQGVAVAIDWQHPVWIVARPVSAGQPLSASAAHLEPRAMTHEAAHFLPVDAKLGEYETRLMLRPGSVLDDRQIRRIPAVRLKQEVRILLETAPGMQVMILGTAMADGVVGEVVRVQQTNFRKKVYLGQVVAPGVVKVTF